ncbi:MAG: hypothetical protein ACK5KQ_05670 [Anaerorhabdus sp.]
MKIFKNVSPYEIIDSKTFVKNSKNGISSKAVIDNNNVEMRFFSASKGEDIDKEIYFEETLFFCLEGKLKVIYKDDGEVILNSNDMVVIESNVLYGIVALEDTKYFNILVK